MDKINAIKLISAQKEAIEQVKDFNISSKEFKIWYNEQYFGKFLPKD